MRLGGLLKNTALDFPGLFSAMVFTQGCNFRCPYCHNPHLVRLFGEPVDEDDTLDFLRQRRKYLDGVVISGGEPTIQPDLAEFCKKLCGMGYEVKLDTNGSRPEVMAELLERKLISYVALDLKADPGEYPSEIAPNMPEDSVLESIAVLKRSAVSYEFRTTCAFPFINLKSLEALAKAAAGSSATLFLQKYRPDFVLNPKFMAEYADQPTDGDMEAFRALASKYLSTVIR